jgi:hypothetical protein
MHIDRIPLWLLGLVVLVALALFHAWRRGWLRPPLETRELAIVGKVLFIVGSIMILVMLRNSIELPAGQFIYGRF